MSTLFFRTVRQRLFFGWGLGFFLSFVGMVLSYKLDLPAGAFIVVCFAAVPVMLLILSPVLGLKRLK
ncbi:MAG: metal ABC transporter permease [Deltaproteobacteria bacterium]|nr:metal ABC transporter permease [Deltaproteobacteria bacterium]